MDHSNLIHGFPYSNVCSLYPSLAISTSHTALVSNSLASDSTNSAVKLHAFSPSPSQTHNNNCISSSAQQHFLSSSREAMKVYQLNQMPHRLLQLSTNLSKFYTPQSILENNAPQTSEDYYNLLEKNHHERTGKFQYTSFEGEDVPCFSLGGEKRLCLPQVLHLLPVKLTLDQVNELMESLGIICTRCKPSQLQLLKEKGIFSSKVPACGLITKSDAERLYKHLQCNPHLLSKRERATAMLSASSTPSNTYNVVHYCFGKQTGKFYSDLYLHESAKAVECNECFSLFTPQEFVGHSHSSSERNTCHWGFDSANWRHYLILSEDNQPSNHLSQSTEDCIYSQELSRQQFDRVKYRFARDHSQHSNSSLFQTPDRAPEHPLDPTTACLTQLSCMPPRKRLKLKAYDQEYNSPSQETPLDIPDRLATPTSMVSSDVIEKTSPIAVTPTVTNNEAISNDEYSPISDGAIEDNCKRTIVSPMSNNTSDSGTIYDIQSSDSKWQTLIGLGTQFIDAVWEDPEIGLPGKNHIIDAFGHLWQAYCEQLEVLNADRIRLRRMVVSLEERNSPSDSSDSCSDLPRPMEVKDDEESPKRSMEFLSARDIHAIKGKRSEHKIRVNFAASSCDSTRPYCVKSSSPITSNITSPISNSATPHGATSNGASATHCDQSSSRPSSKSPINNKGSPNTVSSSPRSFTNVSQGIATSTNNSNKGTTELANTVEHLSYRDVKDEEGDYLGPPDLDCEGTCLE